MSILHIGIFSLDACVTRGAPTVVSVSHDHLSSMVLGFPALWYSLCTLTTSSNLSDALTGATTAVNSSSCYVRWVNGREQLPESATWGALLQDVYFFRTWAPCSLRQSLRGFGFLRPSGVNSDCCRLGVRFGCYLIRDSNEGLLLVPIIWKSSVYLVRINCFKIWLKTKNWSSPRSAKQDLMRLWFYCPDFFGFL